MLLLMHTHRMSIFSGPVSSRLASRMTCMECCLQEILATDESRAMMQCVCTERGKMRETNLTVPVMRAKQPVKTMPVKSDVTVSLSLSPLSLYIISISFPTSHHITYERQAEKERSLHSPLVSHRQERCSPRHRYVFFSFSKERLASSSPAQKIVNMIPHFAAD